MTGVLQLVGAQALLLVRSAQSARREGLSRKEVLKQAAELGAASGLLIAVGMAFFGTVLVTIAWAQARKYTGNISLVGPPYFELIIREFSPLLTALLVASRAAASTSAELGAMAVNEQVEALELSAADPLAELVAPRVLASILTVPLLTALGVVTSAAAAALTVTYAFGADGGSFIDPRFVDGGDLLCAFLKAVLNGAFIPLAASLRGLRARGGAGAVGEAVTLGVVEACMGCLLIDFVVAAVFLILGV
ncbi:MAG: ABC transporter permease [Myxococcales bacterium]|nr:ABC transporter permease [Myxococcales bacterium]